MTQSGLIFALPGPNRLVTLVPVGSEQELYFHNRAKLPVYCIALLGLALLPKSVIALTVRGNSPPKTASKVRTDRNLDLAREGPAYHKSNAKDQAEGAVAGLRAYNYFRKR